MQGADNNYAPPKARIADVQPENLVNTPPSVVRAVILLWVFAALTALGSITLSLKKRSSESLVSLTIFVVMVLLAYCVGKRSRGARRVLLVLVGFMLFGAGMRALAVAKTHGSLSISEMSVSALLALYAVLLFTPRANAWFGRRPG